MSIALLHIPKVPSTTAILGQPYMIFSTDSAEVHLPVVVVALQSRQCLLVKLQWFPTVDELLSTGFLHFPPIDTVAGFFGLVFQIVLFCRQDQEVYTASAS